VQHVLLLAQWILDVRNLAALVLLVLLVLQVVLGLGARGALEVGARLAIAQLVVLNLVG
jgi:hypothetical protein